jgi:hypothetical protein
LVIISCGKIALGRRGKLAQKKMALRKDDLEKMARQTMAR